MEGSGKTNLLCSYVINDSDPIKYPVATSLRCILDALKSGAEIDFDQLSKKTPNGKPIVLVGKEAVEKFVKAVSDALGHDLSEVVTGVHVKLDADMLKKIMDVPKTIPEPLLETQTQPRHTVPTPSYMQQISYAQFNHGSITLSERMSKLVSNASAQLSGETEIVAKYNNLLQKIQSSMHPGSLEPSDSLQNAVLGTYITELNRLNNSFDVIKNKLKTNINDYIRNQIITGHGIDVLKTLLDEYIWALNALDNEINGITPLVTGTSQTSVSSGGGRKSSSKSKKPKSKSKSKQAGGSRKSKTKKPSKKSSKSRSKKRVVKK